MSNKELIDFANWLWDMDYLKINFQLQPFNNAESLANHYIKVRELKNNAESPLVSNQVELLIGLLLVEIEEMLPELHPIKHSSTYKQLKGN